MMSEDKSKQALWLGLSLHLQTSSLKNWTPELWDLYRFLWHIFQFCLNYHCACTLCSKGIKQQIADDECWDRYEPWETAQNMSRTWEPSSKELELLQLKWKISILTMHILWSFSGMTPQSYPRPPLPVPTRNIQLREVGHPTNVKTSSSMLIMVRSVRLANDPSFPLHIQQRGNNSSHRERGMADGGEDDKRREAALRRGRIRGSSLKAWGENHAEGLKSECVWSVWVCVMTVTILLMPPVWRGI